MKLRVVSEEIKIRWPMWAVSVSSPPSALALFEEESRAKALAKELESRHANVRVFEVTGSDE